MKLAEDELLPFVIKAVEAKVFMNFALRILFLRRIDRLIFLLEKFSPEDKLVIALSFPCPGSPWEAPRQWPTRKFNEPQGDLAADCCACGGIEEHRMNSRLSLLLRVERQLELFRTWLEV